MARRTGRVKEPLLVNDVEVRDIDTLRENFDIDIMLRYVFDGKLSAWLRDRYYDEEADQVDELKRNDPNLEDKLYDIFEVEPPMDEEEIAWRNERIARLKKFTRDPDILDNVDSVAFDQEDLSDCLDAGISDIYLCNNTFTIPLKVKRKTYIGIGKAVAHIRSTTPIDFKSLHIHFIDVDFDREYQRVLEDAIEETPENLYELGVAAEAARSYQTAIECYEKAADKNHTPSMNKLGTMYYEGNGVKQDYEKAFEWFFKAAEAGDRDAMSHIAGMYRSGQGTKKNFDKAIYWYKEAAKAGDMDADANIIAIQQETAAPQQKFVTNVNNDDIEVDGNIAMAKTMIVNKAGVHSHPAYAFVQTASSFKSKVQITAKGKKCDGKSILMIMSLGLYYGTEMVIKAEGPDCVAAVRALKDLVDNGFGEQ